jgi:S-adenosylmethionine-diacylglycerol 3-amino-3-carboxypropyl transferase
MPVAFAQVREDPLIDQWLLKHIGGDGLRGIAIASGGCTAAALLASGSLARLHLVDANSAQIALCRLKLHLLETASPHERLQLLGHAPLAAEERAARLAAAFEKLVLPDGVLGPLQMVAELGPDHAGRYELLFARLREEMQDCADEWQALLAARNSTDGKCPVDPTTPLGRRLDEAMERVMALPNLVRLFGTEATQNSRDSFSRHFAGRVRFALTMLPASNNPYLWQMLLGRFPVGVPYPWLTASAPARIPEVTFSVGSFNTSLARTHASCDFVHLSNILDWLTPQQAGETLDLARQALKPGGYVLIRQLNSTLDIPSLGRRWEWLAETARDLHARDRSFFYRSLHLGRKQ